jgi:hypothetical protein
MQEKVATYRLDPLVVKAKDPVSIPQSVVWMQHMHAKRLLDNSIT